MDTSLPVLGQRLRALGTRRTGLAAWLCGEAGIGKTYTCRTLLLDTPCRSVTLPAAVPLPTLIRALPRPPRLRPWIGAALDRLQADHAVAMPVADVLAAVLGHLAPFVLCLEDLHDVDPDRHVLIGHLAASMPAAHGAALLVTSRMPMPAVWPAGILTVPLNRLSPQHSAALLEAVAGADMPSDATTWIHERAQGNPLFTLEYFRFLARQGHLWNGGDHWRWRPPLVDALPVTVEAVIEHGLYGSGSSADMETLTGALAVLPADLGDTHLAAVTGLGAARLRDAMADLRRRGVLLNGTFAHPLYREVARRRLPPHHRQELARRAIAALHGAPQTAARLIDEAGLTPDEATALLLTAAHTAPPGTARGRLLGRAAAHASGAQRVELALESARAVHLDDLPEALRLTRMALDENPGDPDALGLCAELLASQGHLADAEATLNRLPPADRGGAAWWARVIGLRSLGRDHRGVLDVWQSHPELHLMDDHRVRYAVAFASATMNHLDQATQLVQQTLTWPGLDAATRCDLTNVLGIVHYHRGDFAGAAACQGQAVTMARTAGLTHLEAAYLSNRAISLGELGRFHEREADLNASLALYLARGKLLQATQVQVSLADAHLDHAHYQRAEELLLDARDVLTRVTLSEHLVECEYRLSVLYRHWAPPHGGALSLKHARAALAHARELGVPGKLAWALGYASIAESCFASASEGTRLGQDALGLAAQLQAPGPLGMARFALAFALEAEGRIPEALHAFEAAEADLRVQNVVDAAEEVGLEADRLGGRAGRAATRLAGFVAAGQDDLASVARRYFPALTSPEARSGPPHADGFTPSTSPAPTALRLDVLGSMQFGSPGATVPVRGRKRRELLTCLIEAHLQGRPEVTRVTLTDTLYPGVEDSQAASALKELVHQARISLGAGVIQTTQSGYALGTVDTDAGTFLGGGATSLWRGPYLAGEDLAAGGHMADILYAALAIRVETMCEQQPAEAARVGRMLCEANPYDLAALTLTLRALRAARNHRSLTRLYAAAREGLADVGEHLPEDWAAFLETRSVAGQDRA